MFKFNETPKRINLVSYALISFVLCTAIWSSVPGIAGAQNWVIQNYNVSWLVFRNDQLAITVQITDDGPTILMRGVELMSGNLNVSSEQSQELAQYFLEIDQRYAELDKLPEGEDLERFVGPISLTARRLDNGGKYVSIRDTSRTFSDSIIIYRQTALDSGPVLHIAPELLDYLASKIDF